MPDEYIELMNLGSSYGGKTEWCDDLVYNKTDGKYYVAEWCQTDNGRSIQGTSTEYKLVDETLAGAAVLEAIAAHRQSLLR